MMSPRSSSVSIPLGLGLLLLFQCCAAQLEQVTSSQGFMPLMQGGRPLQQQRHTPFRSQQGECQIRRLDALEPSRRIEAEAGYTELWDIQSDQQLQCAGVAFTRHVIRQRGLYLPAFTNTAELLYVVQGQGLQGVAFPGCPETFQSPQQQSQSQTRFGGAGRMQSERMREDRHQKIRQVREGDVLALPAGVAHWIYNNGQSDLVLVSLIDTSNFANQLDQNVRKFFIAGNPQSMQGGQGRRRVSRGTTGAQESFGNIFSGFDDEFLSESFNVEPELTRRLKGEDDRRGHIVEVQKELKTISPQYQEEGQWQRERQSRRWSTRGSGGGYNSNVTDGPNGLEETLCTLRLKQNIDNPARADVYNPRGGRITTLNSFSLPILGFLQLSIERGVLYRDAIVAPHYHMNCHGVIYVTRGNGRLQIVGDQGETVFDGELREHQLLVIPQNYAVVKRAGSEGFEYVTFRTSDTAMISPLAGRLSVFRSLPVEVIMNSYGISREEANRIKYNRQELAVFSPGSRFGSRRGSRWESLRDGETSSDEKSS